MAFGADAGGGAVAGVDDGGVGELQDFTAQGVHDLGHGAAPKIGAADAAREERVARKKTRRGNGDCAGVLR